MNLLGLDADRYAAHLEALRAVAGDPGEVYWTPTTQDVLYRLVSHGVPQRFSHWTFAVEYERLRQRDSRIYEFVTWADPAEAYIDQTLSAAEADAIAAHVLGHVWLFTHHPRFQARRPLSAEVWEQHAVWVEREQDALTHEVEALARRRVAEHPKQAAEVYEQLPAAGSLQRLRVWPVPDRCTYVPALDACLALEAATLPPWEREAPPRVTPVARIPTQPDAWTLWRVARGEAPLPEDDPRRDPTWQDPMLERLGRPHWDAVDVVDVIQATTESPRLREALAWLREEWDYFWTLRSCKLLHEGIATYWHRRRTADPLLERWLWEQVRLRSAVEFEDPLNPYWLGSRILEALEAEGEDPWAWVLQGDDPVFLQLALTPERVERLRLYIWELWPGTAEFWEVRRASARLEAVGPWLAERWRALIRGGIGTPQWRWHWLPEGEWALELRGFWSGTFRPLEQGQEPPSVNAHWLVDVANLLGRPYQVWLPKGVKARIGS